ncbi:sigma-70 family RNA polymerase sigma factor [Clostridium sp. PL3]|uniref:Sigma-70 family RNA polymerase sigma factor n=1 Tax=Clostridium thailandense TaxID=2794346 RepID=A0A949TZS1_9CLOT|nr:sigma-70 family RNA polymerase sigma factor [Clostridium thailandense]MBV7273838.1 sigma-70 family RNA polymerase sigma factor [Clostridium thailandense]
MEEIIEAFRPFVIKTARSIYIRSFDINDLIQIGMMSIIKAVEMFDVNRGNAFTSYMFNAVKINFYNLIRTNIKRASECSANSLNKEGFELIDNIVSEENLEEDMVKKEEKVMLTKALNKLSEKDREVVHWFYFENKDLKSYAVFKSISYRTAVARKKSALIKLKKYLEEMNYNGIL